MEVFVRFHWDIERNAKQMSVSHKFSRTVWNHPVTREESHFLIWKTVRCNIRGNKVFFKLLFLM